MINSQWLSLFGEQIDDRRTSEQKGIATDKSLKLPVPSTEVKSKHNSGGVARGRPDRKIKIARLKK